MPMPAYPVTCYTPGCSRSAHYKIAAGWSDGVTSELKTYALACPVCVEILFADSERKRATCRLAPGEKLDVLSVYELHRGDRDKDLKRRSDLEAASITSGSP